MSLAVFLNKFISRLTRKWISNKIKITYSKLTLCSKVTIGSKVNKHSIVKKTRKKYFSCGYKSNFVQFYIFKIFFIEFMLGRYIWILFGKDGHFRLFSIKLSTTLTLREWVGVIVVTISTHVCIYTSNLLFK